MQKFNIKKNMIYVLLEYFVKFFVSFFITLRIAKKIGVSDYGELNYFLSVVTIITIISNFGIDGYLVSKLSIIETDYEKKKLISSSIMLNMIIYILSWSLFIIVGYFVTEKVELTYIYMSVGYFFSIFKIFQYYFIAIGDSHINSKYQLFSLLISTILKLIYLLYFDKLLNYIIILAAIEIIIGIGYIFLYIKLYKGKLIENFMLNEVKNILKDCLPLFISVLSVNLYMRVDQIMLKMMLNSYELGIYSSVVKLTEIWYVIPAIIIPIFIPKISSNRKNEELYEKSIEKLLSLLLLLSFILVLPYILFSKEIMLISYGASFIEGSNLLRTYSILLIIMYLGSFRGKWMIMEGKQKYLMIFGIIGLMTNIILNIFLIPKYKSMGATIASIISQVTTNYLLLFLFKDTRAIAKIQSKAILGVFCIKKNMKLILEKEDEN